MEPLPLNEYNRYPDALARFNKDTAGHVMTIAHDDGLYRHLQFRDPKSYGMWFDVHTAPGILTIDGDMGTFTFKRTEDMFTFFIGKDIGSINPGYWAEKLKAANYGRYDGDPVRRFDENEFKEWVFDQFWQDSREMGNGEARAAWELVRETIFEGWYTNNKSTPDNETEAVNKLRDYHRDTREHEFYDWGDAVEGWKKYTVHYIWNCYAIIAAIRAYRAVKEA